MQLTDNFWLREFKVSADFPELAEKIQFSGYDKQVLRLLCDSLLQPVRTHFGQLDIISGKRSLELNTAVGGNENSKHMIAAAADFTIPNVGTHAGEQKLNRIFQWITDEYNTQYRTCIYYQKKKFIHVSVNLPGIEYKHVARIIEREKKTKGVLRRKD